MKALPIVPEHGHRPAHNATGATIPAGRIVKMTGLVSGTTLPTIALCDAATDTPFGVTAHSIADGCDGDVQVAGRAVVQAGAQLSTVGTRLTSDSTGRAVAATVSAATVVGVLGLQATTSGAANDYIEVELMQHGGVAIGGSGGQVHLKLAISHATADNATLWTAPANFAVYRCYWEATEGFAGGTASAIGISSDTAPNETAGDLLGGASGDVTATLGTAGYIGGTVGASLANNGVAVILAGDTIQFDRIVDAFTSGHGFVHVVGEFIP